MTTSGLQRPSPSQPPGSSEIEQLPSETIELIVLRLDLESIRNVRLTSRTMAYKSSQTHFRSYCPSTQYVELTVEGLTTFSQKLSRCKPCGFLEHIVFAGVVDRETAESRKSIVPDSLPPGDTAQSWRSKQFVLAFHHHAVFESYRAVDLLTEICRNLKDNTKNGKLASVNFTEVVYLHDPNPPPMFWKYYWPAGSIQCPLNMMPGLGLHALRVAVSIVELEIDSVLLEGEKTTLELPLGHNHNAPRTSSEMLQELKRQLDNENRPVDAIARPHGVQSDMNQPLNLVRLPGSSLIESLPAENIELIVLHLDVASLCNLRLTSKQMAWKATQTRFRSLCATRKVELTVSGLSRFAGQLRSRHSPFPLEHIVFAVVVEREDAPDRMDLYVDGVDVWSLEHYQFAHDNRKGDLDRKRGRPWYRRDLELFTEILDNLKHNTKDGKLSSISFEEVVYMDGAQPSDRRKNYYWPSPVYSWQNPLPSVPDAGLYALITAAEISKVEVDNVWIRGERTTIERSPKRTERTWIAAQEVMRRWDEQNRRRLSAGSMHQDEKSLVGSVSGSAQAEMLSPYTGVDGTQTQTHIMSLSGRGKMPERPSTDWKLLSRRREELERTRPMDICIQPKAIRSLPLPGSAAMENLPAEMIELIVVHLNLGDHRNVRLASRAMASKSTQTRFRWYLSKKSIELTEEGLQKLIQDTRRGGLGYHLEELVFAGLVDKGKARDCADTHPLASARKRTRTFAKMYESGRLVDLMAEAFFNIKQNTKTGKLVSIRLEGIAHAADQFQRACATPMTHFWPQLPGYKDPLENIPKVALASVRAAVFAAKIDVGSLWLHGEKVSFQRARLKERQAILTEEYNKELGRRLEIEEVRELWMSRDDQDIWMPDDEDPRVSNVSHVAPRQRGMWREGHERFNPWQRQDMLMTVGLGSNNFAYDCFAVDQADAVPRQPSPEEEQAWFINPSLLARLHRRSSRRSGDAPAGQPLVRQQDSDLIRWWSDPKNLTRLPS